jgi:hypothetical protein
MHQADGDPAVGYLYRADMGRVQLGQAAHNCGTLATLPTSSGVDGDRLDHLQQNSATKAYNQ